MRRLLLFFLFFPLWVAAQTSPVLISLDAEKYHDLSIKEADGIYSISTSGKDPYVFTFPLSADLNKRNSQLSFEYFCPTGVDFIEVFFYPLQEKIGSFKAKDVGSTEGWVTFKMDISPELGNWGQKGDFLRLDFGESEGLAIQVRNIKLRPKTAREMEIQVQAQAKKEEEAVLEVKMKKYLQNKFPNQIQEVLVTDTKITVRGKAAPGKQLFLAEVGLHEQPFAQNTFAQVVPLPTKKGTFEMEQNRHVKRHGFTQDRLLSRWAVVEKTKAGYALASHARYADSVVSKYNYPPTPPTSKKGLGGYSSGREAPSSDLADLGITSVTVNIWINQMFRSQPSPQNQAFNYQGKTFYVDKQQVEKFDQTLLTAAKRGIEVSVILLVGKAEQSPDKIIGKMLQHPDTDPAGIYAMPNVTSPEGVQYYAAILDFLAARYSRADGAYGRIHHYIIHNEVDAGWVWTNAGDKTSLVFLDLYHKSMRMSYNIARAYNPNAKVFISLTHYWNWTSNTKFYHSRELLEHLLDFSEAEGNFEWAIAQHPYPESLREPKVWLDKKITFDFNSPLITFKNIEVLDAWVRQPRVLYKGKRRTVYLSENGTNSPSYSPQDLHEQAAGLAYALKKIEHLSGIDGFQYHNWQDNRKEGGLRIGLRRYPDDADEPGGKKPVWYVFSAFGTPDEEKVFGPYKATIGIKSWDEIKYKGLIQ